MMDRTHGRYDERSSFRGTAPYNEAGRRHVWRRPHEDGDTGASGAVVGGLALLAATGALAFWLRGSRTEDDAGRRSRRQRDRIPMDETDDLIASNKVEGTAVYDRNGEKIGSVYNFMVGKRSGRVAYAVVAFGGFLGLGTGYHPLPWEALTFDEDRGGYVVDVDRDVLKNAPKHEDTDQAFLNPSYNRQLTEYWLLIP